MQLEYVRRDIFIEKRESGRGTERDTVFRNTSVSQLIFDVKVTYQGEEVCVAVLQTGAVSLMVLMRHGSPKHFIFISQHLTLVLMKENH